MHQVDPSEITSESAYLTRRDFLVRSGIMALGGLAVAACADRGLMVTPGAQAPPAPPPAPPRVPTLRSLLPPDRIDELGNPATVPDFVRSYGHYYEFSRDRMKMDEAVGDYEPPPVTIQVGGLVRNPVALHRDELRQFGEEERIYRHRCIECWAMVIPWLGVPLRRLLEVVQPTPDARFVRFESLFDPQLLPGQRPGAYVGAAEESGEGAMEGTEANPYKWPYVEGLRLDEAMHDLTILATGMHDKPLPPANGAPVRLVVPWKYAFKSIKNVTRIDLVADMPVSFWMVARPTEHGFYANVNPEVPHPRWEQVKEVRYRGVCPEEIVPTLMFNGYEEKVAHLYEGMDLEKNF